MVYFKIKLLLLLAIILVSFNACGQSDSLYKTLYYDKDVIFENAQNEINNQNGEKIFLEKEKEFITVYIYDMLQLNLIEHLDGIMHYKQVFNEVC